MSSSCKEDERFEVVDVCREEGDGRGMLERLLALSMESRRGFGVIGRLCLRYREAKPPLSEFDRGIPLRL